MKTAVQGHQFASHWGGAAWSLPLLIGCSPRRLRLLQLTQFLRSLSSFRCGLRSIARCPGLSIFSADRAHSAQSKVHALMVHCNSCDSYTVSVAMLSRGLSYFY